jgi:hypothetical protein
MEVPLAVTDGSLLVSSHSVSFLLLVAVRIHVFSVLRIAPSGDASCTKQSRKNLTSSRCSKLLQSSTYAKVRATEPSLSLPLSPSNLRWAASDASSCCS